MKRRLLALVFGCLVVLCAELLLRASGKWSDPAQIAVYYPKGTQAAFGLKVPPVLEAVPENPQRIRVPPELIEQGFMKPLTFSKDASHKRIFCFGGSAAVGVPVDAIPEQTFPGQIAGQLQQMGISSEVLNVGGASFGSAQVRSLALSAMELDPAALIVYAGNNEFFNYGLHLLSQNGLWQPTHHSVHQLHLFRALSEWIGADHTEALSAANVRQLQDQILAEMLIAELSTDSIRMSQTPDGLKVERNDTFTKEVLSSYINNLRTVSAKAEQHNVPLLIALVPYNLYTPPWLSGHHPALSDRDRKRWMEQVTAARNARSSSAAEQHWRQAIAIDNWAAEAHYGLGQVLNQQENVKESKHHLRMALELDLHPGRPTPEMHKRVLSEQWGNTTTLVSFDEGFQDPDAELFHDSCHLTSKGYSAVASTFTEALISQLGWGIPQ